MTDPAAPDETELENYLRDRVGGYLQLPQRAAEILGETARDDEFGVRARLSAIRGWLTDRTMADVEVVDLGGNCGYFALSLLDAGVARAATVFDPDEAALSFGRAAATLLGRAREIRFRADPIDLAALRALPASDVVLCLNLLHHAGGIFDVAEVSARGWGAYVEEFLGVLSEKCGFAAIGMGYKGDKPVNWDASAALRHRAFLRHVRAAGWSVALAENVQSLADALDRGRTPWPARNLNPLSRLQDRLA